VRRYRELLTRVLGGESVEICPVFCWKHHPELDQNAGTLAAATLAFQERFDCDLVKVSPASTYQLRDYGLVDAWRNDPVGRRSVENVVVQTPEDWFGLPRLDPRTGFTGRLVEAVGLVRQALPAEIPVTITVFDPIFQAVTLAGLECLHEHMRLAPEAVMAGLDRILENSLDLIAVLRSEAIDGIFLASQQALLQAFSAEEYIGFGLPGDQACLAAAAGLPFNMVHLHGSAVHAALFQDVPGIMLHYDANPTNPRPDSLLARGVGVSTGPSPTLLASDGPDAAVTAACEALLESCKGRSFVLSPGCSVPLAVEAERLDAFIAAARTPRPDRAFQ